MSNDATPQELDWVTARAECSASQMFKRLQKAIHSDVQKMAEILQSRKQDATKLSFSPSDAARFSVIREGQVYPLPTSHSVDFAIEKGVITVKWDGAKPLMEATISLTKEGRCQFKVGDSVLEEWQFRQMALERLFFETA